MRDAADAGIDRDAPPYIRYRELRTRPPTHTTRTGGGNSVSDWRIPARRPFSPARASETQPVTPIDIRPADLETVRRILREHVPALEGSGLRITSGLECAETSDLDLALMTDEPLSIDRTAKLRAAFTGSDLPVEWTSWNGPPHLRAREQIRLHSTPVAGAGDVSEIKHRVETAPHWVRREVCDLIRDGVLVVGDGYRAKNSELSSSGLPFARAGNIAGGFRFSVADRFPEDGLHKVGDKTSRPGDVVFTSKGTVGRFAFVRADTGHFVYSAAVVLLAIYGPGRPLTRTSCTAG